MGTLCGILSCLRRRSMAGNPGHVQILVGDERGDARFPVRFTHFFFIGSAFQTLTSSK